MHKNSTELKIVRQFKKVSALTVCDEAFTTWNQKSWKKRAIEIGCGAGLHPIQFASQNPETALVALERTKIKFNSFSQRTKSHSLENIYPVNKDALFWLPGNISANTIDEYFLLYPNPYPKEEQANKRWHRSSLMHFIIESLKPLGKINIASNEAWYMDECKNYFENYWKLKLISNVDLSQEADFNPRTHFERKYLKRNLICRNMIFQKQ